MTIILSLGLSKVTMAGYGGKYPGAAILGVGTSPIIGGTNGNCLTISAGVLGNATCGGTSALTVGTTAIANGTNTYIEYNSSGTLGEYAIPLAIALGGTGQITAPLAINALLPSQTGKSTDYLTTNGTVTAWGSFLAIPSDLVPSASGTNELGSPSDQWQYAQLDNLNLWANGNAITLSANAGIASSYNLVLPSSQGNAGQTFIDDGSGNLSFGGLTSLSGTLAIAHGGTGQATANTALNALLPTQTGNNTKFLQTNGTSTSWATAGPFTSRAAAYITGSSSTPFASPAEVPFDTLVTGFGSTSEFDTVTHPGRFTSTNGGIYQVNAQSTGLCTGACQATYMYAAVNGTEVFQGPYLYNGASAWGVQFSGAIQLNAGDYVELFTVAAGGFPGWYQGQVNTWVSIVQIQ